MKYIIFSFFFYVSTPFAYAFDYLEHLYFSDQACLGTQQQIKQVLLQANPWHESHDELLLNYFALSLYCPLTWDKPYCENGYKNLESAIHKSQISPTLSSDYAVTLGDISALADHNARFGPLQQVTHAQEQGLTYDLIHYLSQSDGKLRWTLEDVAEDACEVGDLADFTGVQSDINLIREKAKLENINPYYFNPFLRQTPNKGPSDPAGLYSFDNPHYLDLVFRNHNHFGSQAYEAWSGLHGNALAMRALSCESIMAENEEIYDELVDLWSDSAQDWARLDAKNRIALNCHFLKKHLVLQLKKWLEFKNQALDISKITHQHQSSISNLINDINRLPSFQLLLNQPNIDDIIKSHSEALDHLASAWLSLILEGTGLHFLQDIIAGGHLRTIRTRGGLKESRYDHDEDNRRGVSAILQTKSDSKAFVAFGDTYLLAKQSLEHIDCDQLKADPNASMKVTAAQLTKCLIQYQRQLLYSMSKASLMDWARGHHTYHQDYQAWVDAFLPIQPITVMGEKTARVEPSQNRFYQQGNLPLPPPPFKYESLSNRWGFDLRGNSPQINLQLSFLEELGRFAHWLTSFQLGIYTNIGDAQRRQWISDFGYHFHWRWAARFTVNMGVSGYMGWRGLDQDVSFFMGLSPVTGITLLPEGWIKMPLEITIAYRLPLTFFDSKIGFPGSHLIEGHFLYLGFGLAFMN